MDKIHDFEVKPKSFGKASANENMSSKSADAQVVMTPPIFQLKANNLGGEAEEKEEKIAPEPTYQMAADGSEPPDDPGSPPSGDDSPASSKPNNTGLPNQLKSGVENLSGFSLDDVNVHYNSAKPAQLQAHAYAQGSDIHLGPGQERHLPHEAWHVVQQKQGRVKPTLQMKGIGVNDDSGLEKEADVMGAKAMQMKSHKITKAQKLTVPVVQKKTIQLYDPLRHLIEVSSDSSSEEESEDNYDYDRRENSSETYTEQLSIFEDINSLNSENEEIPNTQLGELLTGGHPREIGRLLYSYFEENSLDNLALTSKFTNFMVGNERNRRHRQEITSNLTFKNYARKDNDEAKNECRNAADDMSNVLKNMQIDFEWCGVLIWSNLSSSTPINHYSLIMYLDHKMYVVDPTFQQFGSQPLGLIAYSEWLENLKTFVVKNQPAKLIRGNKNYVTFITNKSPLNYWDIEGQELNKTNEEYIKNREIAEKKERKRIEKNDKKDKKSKKFNRKINNVKNLFSGQSLEDSSEYSSITED